jgi:hypothetical protein
VVRSFFRPREAAPIALAVSGKSGGVDFTRGRLAACAASVLMKLLYGARMARFDLLRAINSLAPRLATWDVECDKRLHRVMCYVHSAIHLHMVGWVGHAFDDCGLRLYSDADFAGCARTERSTSGLSLRVVASDTRFPLSGQSTRQSCVSHSTPEAEMVAADWAFRTVGRPFLDFWSALSGVNYAPLHFHEDSQAMIAVVRSGRNPTTRHLGPTFRVTVAWLCEAFKQDLKFSDYTETQHMAADIFTKGFTDPGKWRHACHLINVGVPEALFQFHIDTWPLAFSVLDTQGGGRQPPLNEKEARLKERVAYWTEPPCASDVPAGVPDDVVCAPCAVCAPCERAIPPCQSFIKTEPKREYQIPAITYMVDALD